MATILEIQNALGSLIQTAVYPNGTNNPSIANCQVNIVSGWPIKNRLDADLLAGNAQVSIYQVPGLERQAPWLARVWRDVAINPATITLTVSGSTVTVGGTISTPQSCMIVVNDIGYPYAIQSIDTLNTIAENIAAILPSATSLANVITISDAYKIEARISTSGTAVLPLKRQEMGFMLSIWSPNFTIRDVLGSAIDAACTYAQRIQLPDQLANLNYKKQSDTDMLEKSILYRRDLFYTVTYETTLTQTFYTISNITEDVEQVQSIPQ